MPDISSRKAAYYGAMAAVAAVMAYSVIITLWVVIRSSATIYSMMPKGERSTILWVNGVSVAYSVAVFSLLMSAVSAAAGAIAAVSLNSLLHHFNPRFNAAKALRISCTLSLILITILYLLLHTLLKERMTLIYPETFLFWFLFPAGIFLAVCLWGGIQLNRCLSGNASA